MRTGWDGGAVTAQAGNTLDVPRPGTVVLFQPPGRTAGPTRKASPVEVSAPSSNPVIREQQTAAADWVAMVKATIDSIETPGLPPRRREAFLQATLDILGKQIASGFVGSSEGAIRDWVDSLGGNPGLLALIYNRADRLARVGGTVRRI